MTSYVSVKIGTQCVHGSTTKASSSAGNLPNLIWMNFDGWNHFMLMLITSGDETVLLSQSKRISNWNIK